MKLIELKKKCAFSNHSRSKFNVFLLTLDNWNKNAIVQKPVAKKLIGGLAAPINASNVGFKIPPNVRKEAQKAMDMRDAGFYGGTLTGWNRGKQLANKKYISEYDATIMRAWFARHGPKASNGGTSYRGYAKWVKNGEPQDTKAKKNSRGALAWLLWGGNPGFEWITKICPKKRKFIVSITKKKNKHRQPKKRRKK